MPFNSFNVRKHAGLLALLPCSSATNFFTTNQHYYYKRTPAMEALVDKFRSYEAIGAWNEVFLKMQRESDHQIEKRGLTVKTACEPQNQLSNRYYNVLPYDQNRVVLSKPNDYVNASPYHCALTGRDYIFTQGPLEETVEDFWSMIWEQKANIIVMLSACFEGLSEKCYPYFPSNEDNSTSKTCGEFTIDLVEEHEEQFSYVVRTFKLSRKASDSAEAEHRVVHQRAFIGWPDYGIPEDSAAFIKFVEAVRELDDKLAARAPIVCHCSAGIGRTGTFAVVDIFLSAFRSGRTEDLPLVDELIIKMRQSRMECVQTPSQFRFAWKTVADWIGARSQVLKESTED